MSKKIPDIDDYCNEILKDSFGRKLAKKEGIALESDSLEDEAKRNSHGRRENFRNHIKIAAICLFWVGVICIMSLILTEAWHLITPQKYHYIDDNQKSKIETILFSGALAAMVSGFSKKYT